MGGTQHGPRCRWDQPVVDRISTTGCCLLRARAMRPSATAARVRQQPKSGQPAGSAVAARASHRLPLLDPCCCRLSKRESPWTTVGKHTVGGGPVNPAFTCDNASRCRSAQCAKTVGGRTFSRSAACRRRHAASPPLAIVCSADRRCRSGSGHGSGDSGGRWRVEGQAARVRPRVSGRACQAVRVRPRVSGRACQAARVRPRVARRRRRVPWSPRSPGRGRLRRTRPSRGPRGRRREPRSPSRGCASRPAPAGPRPR